jgi:hypothetical protein
MSQPYLELARLLHRQPESAALALALAELGIGNGGFDDEGLDFQKAGLGGKTLEEFKKLDKAAQSHLISMAMRAEREHEPETVTGHLRQLRLLQQVHEDGDLDRETVDAVLGEGESIAPLLVGLLRGWAQDLLGDEDDSAVENALALLGETGSASEIPHLLEFVDLDHEDAAGAATWALGRIVDRHNRSAAKLPGVRRRSFEIAVEGMESVRLSNTDGEELLFSKAVYRITIGKGRRASHSST